MIEIAQGPYGGFNIYSIWRVHGMKSVGDKVPLVFRFFWLVTRDNITYISPRENAFWMSISKFVAIVAPCDL